MDIKLIFTSFHFFIMLPIFAHEQQQGVELCKTLITALNSSLKQDLSSEKKLAIENAIKYVQDLKEQISKTKNINMYIQNSSGDFVVLKENESVKFTCNDTWRYIGCYVPKDTTVTDETIYPMLVEVNEDGTYSTEYEQYKSSTTIIQLSEPLRAIGDIKDEITKDGIVRRIGTREYISGDELDSTIITDNTTTYYVLSTPTTEQITNEQKVALNSLVSFKDKTYIETSDLYAKATLDLDYFNSDSGALALQNENKLGKLEQAIIELGGTI